MSLEEAKAQWKIKAQATNDKDNYEFNTVVPAITLANMLEINKSQDIIEVGCATGVFTLHYLQNLTNAKTFTSVDASEKMIDLANARKAATEGINKDIKHEFVLAKAENMDFIKDESIDTYVSSLCLHLVPDERKFLEEAKRILRKGGKIGLIVPCKEEGFMGTVMDHFEANGWKNNLPKDYTALGKREIMIKLLEENGFKMRFCWEDYPKLPYYEDSDVENQLTSGPLSMIFNSFNEETKKVVKENILKEFADMKKKFIPFQMKVISIVAQKP